MMNEKIVLVKVKGETPIEKLNDLYRIENNLLARVASLFGTENKNFLVNYILPKINLNKRNTPIEATAFIAALIGVFKEWEMIKPVTVLEKSQERFSKYVKQITETVRDRQLLQQTNRMKFIELYDDLQYWK